ncbi:Bifunctional epoxide hydrolase 2 [Aphelenchoides besseyi]|nr:Bifunctional epoxide hydrolase 2 [Aphelenchoides besseyi]KAI6193900.1 Bifunctional epoxide hydrolase 2 [Aphelenchoides besseyi]
MKPSCVIFDMGGVVVRFKNYGRFVELLNEARKDPKIGEKFVGFELGTVSAEEIRDTFHRIFPLPLDVNVDDFENSKLDDYMGEHDPHIEKAIEKLKANGIKLGLLTNNGYWSPKRERTTILDHADEIFDVVVESAREGVRKPDPKIYEIMLERIGKKAEECVFVDDLKQNVDAAASLGFIAIHLANEDSEAAVKKLEELLDLDLH